MFSLMLVDFRDPSWHPNFETGCETRATSVAQQASAEGAYWWSQQTSKNPGASDFWVKD